MTERDGAAPRADQGHRQDSLQDHGQDPVNRSGTLGGLVGYFVGHRTAANLLMAVMLVAGVLAGTQIRAQFFPDVPIEVVRWKVSRHCTHLVDAREEYERTLRAFLRA